MFDSTSQVAQQSWWHWVCGVRWCCVLQQRTHTKYSQVWPEDPHQERRSHYHKRQLPWHFTLPLGREIRYWPGCGREWPVGDLRHRGQQRATRGQPGGRATLHIRGWDGDCEDRIISNLIGVIRHKIKCHKCWDYTNKTNGGKGKGSHRNPIKMWRQITNHITFKIQSSLVR